MTKLQAVKILKSESSTGEQIKEARLLLLKTGVLRLQGNIYEIQAKWDKFQMEVFGRNPEDWIFFGYTSPYDGI